MTKILIVEDDLQYQTFLLETLQEVPEYEVIAMKDSPVEVLMNHAEYECDLLITDYMMPVMNGIDFVTYFKRVFPNVKILLLTALEEEEIELQALELDIDCFLNKKMSSEKLLKYIERTLQQPIKKTVSAAVLHSEKEKIVVNVLTHEVTKKDQLIELTNTEFKLLAFMLQNKGKALTREEFLNNVWADNSEAISERIVDTHVKILRRKLHIHCIQSIRGIGYKWDE